MNNKTVKINNHEPEIAVEVIAEAVIAISKGMEELKKSRLTNKAIILLITEACPQIGGSYRKKNIPMGTVKAVLEGIENLKREYIK